MDTTPFTPLLRAVFAFALTLGAAPASLAAVIDVSTSTDEFNTSPNGQCSVREAIRSANDNADFGGCTGSGAYNNDTVRVPIGTFTLTRAGIDEDFGATADLDIRGNLTLQGAGSTQTSIVGAAGYSGRIIHVLLGNSVLIRDVRLRGGDVPNGRAGGGVRIEPGTTVTILRTSVALNTSDGSAGGILNRANLTLDTSVVDGNVTLNATQGGGGVFNAGGATLTVIDSRVIGNTTTGTDANGSGAGIFNDIDGVLNVENSIVDGNVIDVRGTLSTSVDGDGGGIFSRGPFTIRDSTISNNIAAGSSALGGGVACRDVTNVIVEASVLRGNRVERNADIAIDLASGGGISLERCDALIRDSVIDANVSADESGGIHTFDGTVIIARTTISNNRATGSGAFSDGGGASLGNGDLVVDSTIVGNQADGDGGGIFAGAGLTILSSTIAANTSNADGLGGGAGGGLYLESSQASATVANSVFAGNLENGIGDHDDCEGILVSQGHNLVQQSSGCSVVGGSGDQLNTNAGLAPLANNGGPTVGASNATPTVVMLTRAPSASSPLLDGGDPSGCKDAAGVVLLLDQRGLSRTQDGPDAGTTATCDIGAVEVQAVPDAVLADGFE
jgi:hypothetical protein